MKSLEDFAQVIVASWEVPVCHLSNREHLVFRGIHPTNLRSEYHILVLDGFQAFGGGLCN